MIKLLITRCRGLTIHQITRTTGDGYEADSVEYEVSDSNGSAIAYADSELDAIDKATDIISKTVYAD